MSVLWDAVREGCGSCTFLLPQGANGGGWCRRYPPQLVTEMHKREEYTTTVEQHRPYMAQDEWCGEYKRAGT